MGCPCVFSRQGGRHGGCAARLRRVVTLLWAGGLVLAASTALGKAFGKFLEVANRRAAVGKYETGCVGEAGRQGASEGQRPGLGKKAAAFQVHRGIGDFRREYVGGMADQHDGFP